ncbi:MAG TPA: helix-turn-helix transcriptional regulator [Thermoanaerobaculia bacterium]|nr:helix-turn-helix transcriptional regulator [Thermoanaerobaculia bacterium]
MKATPHLSAFAQRLAKIKELAGISGRDVAQLLDTTPETVSRWTTGRVEPQRDRLQRVLELEYFLLNSRNATRRKRLVFGYSHLTNSSTASHRRSEFRTIMLKMSLA